MAKVKVKTIVGYFLDEINGGKTEFARAYRMAILGNRNLKWDLIGKIVTYCLPVNSDYTVSIPDDSIKVKKVGVRDAVTNKIVALTENNNLSFNTCGLDGDLEDTFEKENIFSFGDNEFDGYLTESLGKGGYNNIGEYRISEEEGVIVLSPDFCHSEIMIECLSSADGDGDVCVNELVSEALLAFVRWRWHIAKKGVTAFDKQYYKSEWIKEKKNARFRLKRPKTQDMNRIARQSNKYLKS